MVHLNLMRIATKSEKIDLFSEEKTSDLAKKVQKKLLVGDIILMFGEIGVGKTTFVKYLINQFQRIVSSCFSFPTFSVFFRSSLHDCIIFDL